MKVAFEEYNEIMGRIDNSYHEAALKMNLSDSEMSLLYVLNSNPEGCNQSVLYKESGLTKSTANTALKKMERNQFIVIEPGQGRNTWVSVTQSGRDLINRTVQRLIVIENEIYESWTEQEQEMFMRLTRDFSDKFARKVREL